MRARKLSVSAAEVARRAGRRRRRSMHRDACSRRRRRAARSARRRRPGRARRGRGRPCRTECVQLGPAGQSFRRQAVRQVWSFGPCPIEVRDQRREDREQHDQEDDDDADDRDPVAAQPAPRRAATGSALDRARRPRLRAGRVDRPARRRPALTRALPRRTRAQLAGLDRVVARDTMTGSDRRPSLSSGGSSTEQTSRAFGQRGWKRHPCGGSIGDGTSPRSRIRCRAPSSRRRCSGIAESRAFVYGCRGRSKSSSVVGELDDLAEVHDRDPVAHVADDREVVGDEDVREPELVAAGRRAG